MKHLKIGRRGSPEVLCELQNELRERAVCEQNRKRVVPPRVRGMIEKVVGVRALLVFWVVV